MPAHPSQTTARGPRITRHTAVPIRRTVLYFSVILTINTSALGIAPEISGHVGTAVRWASSLSAFAPRSLPAVPRFPGSRFIFGATISQVDGISGIYGGNSMDKRAGW
ncbi:hypothetical protein K435DRAFT_808966 [Dendrothele bispora CBS 962.96]|uniref:Uncharacterized protein n=1 Tax=Dendrothele bispora (strain CBS 962.96) TaxID=1314807 RepID=A0A4S8KZM3_DENBC|nr:hypothetical protein K435DRAFT_808966 [Dendrothele bispora CBS 962.96]